MVSGFKFVREGCDCEMEGWVEESLALALALREKVKIVMWVRIEICGCFIVDAPFVEEKYIHIIEAYIFRI